VYNLNKPDLESTKDKNVSLLQGLPSTAELAAFKKEHENKDRITLIIDDALSLFSNAAADVLNEYTSLITEQGRRNFSIFVVIQDVFPPKMPLVGLIRKNATYTLFFVFPNDLFSILNMGSRQFGGESRASFKKAYTQATTRKNGFLLADNRMNEPLAKKFPL
jgi:hypothetical protein